MTNEEIIHKAQSILYDPERGGLFSREDIGALSAAIGIGRTALRAQQQPNAPLTLDELRRRNGKPIWVCGLPGREIKWEPGWRILEENRVPMRSNSDTALSHWTASYGHTWIAFDHEPEEATE